MSTWSYVLGDNAAHQTRIFVQHLNSFVETQYKAWRARFAVWCFRRKLAHAFIDSNAKCPACGARDGEIRFSEVHKHGESPGVVLHFCHCCKANWGEPPIVKAEAWMMKIGAEEAELLFARPKEGQPNEARRQS